MTNLTVNSQLSASPYLARRKRPVSPSQQRKYTAMQKQEDRKKLLTSLDTDILKVEEY